MENREFSHRGTSLTLEVSHRLHIGRNLSFLDLSIQHTWVLTCSCSIGKPITRDTRLIRDIFSLYCFPPMASSTGRETVKRAGSVVR